MTMTELEALAWPLSRVGEAIEVLARYGGFHPVSAGQVESFESPGTVEEKDLEPWLDWAGARLGIEVESVEAFGSEFKMLLRGAGPALVRYRNDGRCSLLLLLKASSRRADLIGPDRKVRKCSLESLYRALSADLANAILADAEGLLRHANIPERRWTKAKSALLRQRMEGRCFDGCWMLRIPPEARFGTQLSHARLPGYLIGIVAVFASLHALEAAGWVLIGRGALNGRFDPGWLLAWVLILLSMVPLQLAGRWLQGMFSIRFGTLLKRRLLSGALRMNLDSIRQRGVGQLLGQVIESSVFDSLALNGGFAVLVAAIELCLAGWVLTFGAGGAWHVASLLLWILVTLAFIGYYYRRLRRWTKSRLELTHDLVERMVGHRTRLAQESPENRHQDEDRALEQFVDVSRTFDRAFVPLAAGLPRGWLIIGLLELAPEVMLGNAETTGLAIGVGGVLLAYRAFGEIAMGLGSLARALVAWEQIAPLFLTGQEAVRFNTPCAAIRGGNPGPVSGNDPTVLIQARNLVYRYRPHTAAVIADCDLTIYRGDRLLLQGPSGGGKSTLAALLVGLRRPESGLLLLNGLDPVTLGDHWRKQSTAAPQFHENHILSGTLAFNLLMGRRWPPSPEDLVEAEELCLELGLGDLLERMPSGLLQMVGETGWQLSHGERSRLYLARALLQDSQMVVLDESFAALDPETLDRCIGCALFRASTLMVIAHP
ncbi:MAG: ABC transporter ATP-binding protein/permease [Methylococcaceae bacterium]|nr:ABC transporter ATP-binding protein/permease [Methylococcaceae bacterium]